MPGPSLGTNLSALTDWSTAFPMIDLFRMSRPWFTGREGQFDTGQAGMLNLDNDGWVRSFTQSGTVAPFDRVSTILFTGGHTPAGTYVLDWQGAGSIRLDMLPANSIISQSAGRIEFRLQEGASLMVSITATDPRNTGNYLRDIRLYNKQDADLLQAGKIFAPEFLEKIEDFRTLRFMDWMKTNNSDAGTWTGRQPGDAAQVTTEAGASVELMVALANETRTDPWFTLPHKATDAYIRNFAAYVKNNLDPGLRARFEFSNEVWNWSFEQSGYAQSRAEALWGSDVEGGWMQWYGMRASQMANIVADVFGNQTGTRALNVFATQAGWRGLEDNALNAPDWVAAGGTAPKDAPFHIYAIAPYFGGSIGSTDMAAQVDRWVAMGNAGYTAAINYIRNGAGDDTLANIGDFITYHARVARGLGWQLEGYEGGQHIVDHAGMFGGTENTARTAFFVELVKRPAFGQLYQDYFTIWRKSGGGLMAQYSDFGEGNRYGSWGIWDSPYAEDSVRATAVEKFRDSVAAWWADSRPAANFDNGITRVDRDGTDRMVGTPYDDVLVGLGGNNRMFGGAGNDVLSANAGHDLMEGRAGNDILRGRDGNDTLRGGDGRDELWGGNGRDRLHGGNGADLMSGGAGADVFVFTSWRQSKTGQGDRILDFTRGVDKLDFTQIHDNLDFTWRGAHAFRGNGTAEMRYVAQESGPLLLRLDVDGDGRPDMTIQLVGLKQLALSDLIL